MPALVDVEIWTTALEATMDVGDAYFNVVSDALDEPVSGYTSVARGMGGGRWYHCVQPLLWRPASRASCGYCETMVTALCEDGLWSISLHDGACLLHRSLQLGGDCVLWNA